MSRSIVPAAALALLLSGAAFAAEPGGASSAAARVSVSIPSLHGADIPEARNAVTLVALRDAAASLELPPLRVLSTNSDASLSITRRVRGGANARVSRGGRDEVAMTRADRAGASGWTELFDAVEIPSMSPAALSTSVRPITIVYEVWSF